MKKFILLLTIISTNAITNSYLFSFTTNYYFIENKSLFSAYRIDCNENPVFLIYSNEQQLVFYKSKIALIEYYPKLIKNEVVFNKNDDVELIGEKENKFYMNYYLPYCPNGINKIKTFSEIKYKNLYDGIDLIFKIIDNKVLYEFVSQNQSVLQDSSFLRILNSNIENGYILFKNYPRGEILIEKSEIDKHKNKSSIQKYDNNWITFIGGSNNESMREVVVDNNNNIIVSGYSISNNYPITQNGFQKINKGNFDIVISKFSQSGQLLWSTYIGSSGQDGVWNLIVDSKNNIWIAGESWWDDFPVTSDAYQSFYGGGTADCIAVKLDENGQLLYSTYLGGSAYETFADLVVDNFDNVILTGRTFSFNFPITSDAVKNYKNDGYDAILVKFSDSGHLYYSSYLGGSLDEFGEGIAIDKNNNIAISGYSASNDFPIVGNSYQKINKGNFDAFIIKISPDNNIIWSSYFGGNDVDYGSNLACDNNDNFILSGYTQSIDLFTSNQAFQKRNFGGMDAFIVKFSNNGNLIWSTYYGGIVNECLPGYDINDKGGGISIDRSDNILIFNQYTESPDLQMTEDAFQKQIGGKKDAYLAVFDKNGNLDWSSYLGGSQDDFGRGACYDNNDNIIVVGETFSDDFPVSQDAFQLTKADGSDGFIAKFNAPEIQPCEGAFVEYPDFKNPVDIKIVGHADYYNGALRLNPAWKRQQGAAWHSNRIPVSRGFETEFQFSISDGNQGSCAPDGSQPGADGFAFVIQNSGNDISGYSDWGIGYEGIPNSLAIEFDTFRNLINQNKNIDDPNGNHIAVQSLGTLPNTSAHTSSATLALNDTIMELEPFGTSYWVKINYTPEESSLKIYLSKTRKYTKPVIVVNNLELSKLLKLEGDTAAYLGFTGSTGDAWENHDIKYWRICGNLSSGCDITAFDFPTKNSSKDFLYADSAKARTRDDTEYFRLTGAMIFQKGSVWYQKKVPVARGFSTNFTFRITDGDNNEFEDGSIAGADGIAFVIQNYKQMTGKTGGGIGYANIPNSIAVEFDTYNNNLPGDDIDDPNGNHISVQSAGRYNNTANHTSSANLGINDKIIEIVPDGRKYYAKIEYDGISKNMKIYFDDNGKFENLVLEVNNLDLSTLLDLDGGTHAFVGLTSATGNAMEIHEILTWEMCPYPVFPETGLFDEDSRIIRSARRSEFQINIYPQPADDDLIIEFPGSIGNNVDYELYNILGEKISKEILPGVISLTSTNYRIKINTTSIMNGIYYLQIKTNDISYYSAIIIHKTI